MLPLPLFPIIYNTHTHPYKHTHTSPYWVNLLRSPLQFVLHRCGATKITQSTLKFGNSAPRCTPRKFSERKSCLNCIYKCYQTSGEQRHKLSAGGDDEPYIQKHRNVDTECYICCKLTNKRRLRFIDTFVECLKFTLTVPHTNLPFVCL